MNCKQGDLAVVVKAHAPENIGRFVRCVRFLGDYPYFDGAHWGGRRCWLVAVTGTPVWDEVDRKFMWELPAMDDCLKPIRDPGDDAVDETLSWTTPGDRAQRDIERCNRLVAAELCGAEG